MLHAVKTFQTLAIIDHVFVRKLPITEKQTFSNTLYQMSDVNSILFLKVLFAM